MTGVNEPITTERLTTNNSAHEEQEMIDETPISPSASPFRLRKIKKFKTVLQPIPEVDSWSLKLIDKIMKPIDKEYTTSDKQDPKLPDRAVKAVQHKTGDVSWMIGYLHPYKVKWDILVMLFAAWNTF